MTGNGEWWFDITEEPLMNLDLVQYRLKLMEIRDTFKTKLKSKRRGRGFNPIPDILVFWHSSDTEPADNVFGRFSYKCSIPQNCTSVTALGNHSWYLYWNPKIVQKENRRSKIHALCSNTCDFTTPSVDIQKMIIDAFPRAFQLFLGNGLDGKALTSTNEYYVANKGFAPSSSSRRMMRDLERNTSAGSSTGQNNQASSSSTPAPASTASATVAQPIQPEAQPSSSTSTGTSTSSGNKRTLEDAFVDYLKAEFQNLSEDEQGEFKVSSMDVLRKIKQARLTRQNST